MLENDKLFMQRALELAALGQGRVSPNPMVGCVIVLNGQIIGEGWHQQYGGPHAEVHAIAAVADKSLLTGATMYVTLEPCSHHGKTPPCADLIVQYSFKKIHVAHLDSNPLVAGKGIEKIRASGIEVSIGLLEAEASMLNKRFFTFIAKNRPYIMLKWAATADGFIARKDFTSQWITNAISRKLVHQWRTQEDAIVVGTRTAMHDNPSLTARDWQGKQPVRVVIDKWLRLPPTLNLFDGSVPTLVYNFEKKEEKGNTTWVQMTSEHFSIHELVADLKNRDIQSLIVEGGSQLLQSFIDQNLWDEARIFAGNHTFEEGIKAPRIMGMEMSRTALEGDVLQILKNPFAQ